MSPISTSTRLPDEVVIEIFRNSIFSQGDLTDLALVSRRYLNSVRKSLYASVPVTLMRTEVCDKRGIVEEEDQFYEYSRGTTRLWNTLNHASDDLAQLVEEVVFATQSRPKGVWEKKYGTRGSTLETSRSLSISTFLRSAPNANKFRFGMGWTVNESHLRMIVEIEPVEELSFAKFCVEDLELLSDNFPSLKVLRIEDFFTEMYDSPSCRLGALEEFYCTDSSVDLEYFDFLRNGSSTLRHLDVHVAVGISLDYSKFPNLRSLALGSMGLHSDHEIEDSLSTLVRKFWNSLSTSPSLESLSFASFPYEDGFESALFGPVYGLSVSTFETGTEFTRDSVRV
jgi:hypothetical protein